MPTKFFGEFRVGREYTRMRVRERDNYKCRSCGKLRHPLFVQNHNRKQKTLKGKIKLFDVHHLDGMCGKKSLGVDSIKDIDKLITLCHKCHYNHHQFSHKYKNKPK